MSNQIDQSKKYSFKKNDEKISKLSSALVRNIARRKDSKSNKNVTKLAIDKEEKKLSEVSVKATKLYIGLMSGTSADGIDVSIIKTDGINIFAPIANSFYEYSSDFQMKILELANNKDLFLEVEVELSMHHARAVCQILQQSTIDGKDIAAIGFHGQAIYHHPRAGITWQIGNPHILAKETGIDVVYDFRRRDVAFGGNGAPLIPIFLKCISNSATIPCGFLNIGGVSNISYIGEHDDIIGFDTGTGNAMIDDEVRKSFCKKCDIDGLIARGGNVNYDILDKLLNDDFFSSTYPKSLDRNHFSYVSDILNAINSPIDRITTLTHFTVEGIIKAIKQLPNKKKFIDIYVSGGGAKNKFMMELLFEKCNKIGVCMKYISSIGLNEDFIESQGFAYLAARYINNLPSSFPSTTGTSRPTLCGVHISA